MASDPMYQLNPVGVPAGFLFVNISSSTRNILSPSLIAPRSSSDKTTSASPALDDTKLLTRIAEARAAI